MTEAQHHTFSPNHPEPSSTSQPGAMPTGESVTVLRGGAPVRVGRRIWFYAGVGALIIFVVVIVVSFVSAAHDNSRIERLKARGVSVTVTVTTCIGNLGGSGSNASSYTCSGSYHVAGTRYVETIGSMSFSASPGAHISAVADPSRLSTVVIASAVAASRISAKVYIAPGLLAFLFIALAGWFLRVVRRPRSSLDPTDEVPA